MVLLLFAVIVLGIVAWMIRSLSMPEPFKTVAYGILLLILVVLAFRAFGFDVPGTL